ncbi:MAG: hypothetical protein V4760_08785 [Bdellovibrionota bacterium]
MSTLKSVLVPLLFLASLAAQAKGSNEANLIAIGQGISSPTLTSTVNFSSGYTNESPVGVVYQDSIRLTGEYDTDNDSDRNGTGRTGYGAELGYGKSGSAGLALGYYTRDCTNCEGRAAGSAAVVVAGMGVGLRVQKDLYTVGLLFNPEGTHRLGLIAETYGGSTTGNNLKNYGAGYSYVASGWTFTVDASKRDYENQNAYDNRVLVTPSLMVRADFLQISLNDRITLNNRDTSSSRADDTVHEAWVGIGVGGTSWHFAGYGNYVNDIALALSLFF